MLNIGGTAFNLGSNATGTATINGSEYTVTVTDSGATFTIAPTAGGDLTTVQVEELLRNITYENNAIAPSSGDRTINFTLNDGAADSNIATSTISTSFLNGNDYSEPLTGTAQSERLAGYKGQDTLTGGGGDDDFYFAETSDGVDVITDFNTSGSDRLIFSDLIAETNYTDTGSDPIAEGYVVLTHYASVGTMVQIDFDGNGGSTLLKDVVFIDDPDNATNTSSLTASDFVF